MSSSKVYEQKIDNHRNWTKRKFARRSLRFKKTHLPIRVASKGTNLK